VGGGCVDWMERAQDTNVMMVPVAARSKA
jgi:hypothetical protein